MGKERQKMPAVDRLHGKIKITKAGCWEWQRYRDKDGYGTFRLGDKTILAHRASYILHIGPIPDGYCLDHRCRNRACVNPLHVDPITRAENTLKGLACSAINARKVRCIHGHAFDDQNTYRYKGKHRHCRQCNLAAANKYRSRIKGQEQQSVERQAA